MTSMPERSGLQPKPSWNISARRKGAALIANRNNEPPRFDGPEGRDAKNPQVEQRIGGPSEVADGPPDQHRPHPDAASDRRPRDVGIGDELEPVDEGAKAGAR